MHRGLVGTISQAANAKQAARPVPATSADDAALLPETSYAS
jgi:hypothetical protein